MKAIPTIDRVMARVEIDEDGCWVFTGSKTTSGYGQIRVHRQRKQTAVHRVTYEYFVGACPEGLVLDHLCRNRACCNPEHLEPVTNRENYLRGVRRSATTACPLGHPYDEANTYVHINAQGQTRRHCRICMRVHRDEWKERAAL